MTTEHGRGPEPKHGRPEAAAPARRAETRTRAALSRQADTNLPRRHGDTAIDEHDH